MKRIDWTYVGEWIGGVILILAFIGFLCGAGDGPGWWGGMGQ